MKKLIKKLSCAMFLTSIVAVPVAHISLPSIQAQNSDEMNWGEVETTLRKNFDADGIELIYSANVEEEHTYEENDVTVTLHNYAYFEIEDFHRNYQLWFDDQKETGGVIILDVSVDNNTSDTIYHGNTPWVDFTSTGLFASSATDMLDGIESDFDHLDRSIESKSDKRGLFAYAVSPEAMAGLEEDGTAIVELFDAYTGEDFESENRLIDSPKAVIALTEDAEEQVAGRGDLYPDKILEDNLGTKEIIESAEDLEASVESEGIEVEVEGYQFAEFTPNASEASRFTNFTSGVVIANIKLNIYNNTEDEVIDMNTVYGHLVLGGMVETMSESLLELDYYGEVIEPGDMGTYYMVFTMEKDFYDKFAEDSLSLRFDISNTDFEDLHDYGALIVDIER